MRNLMLGLVIAISSPAYAEAGATSPIAFPDYALVKGLNHYSDRPTYDAAVADRRFVMEKLSYLSDGLTVHAYVYRQAHPSGRLPVAIFNRGSWTRPSFAAEMLPMAHRLALAGYIVVAPWYRGSGGDAGRDEMGGADLDDLFNLLPAIKALSYADGANLYLYGESRGGMMVYQALRDGFPVRAAAVYGAFTDLDAMLRDPRWLVAAQSIWPELSTARAALVERRSAMRWPARISVPVLIMQGGSDRSVSPEQSLRFAQALDGLKKPYELWIAEGEDHLMTGRASERDARAAAWFQSHTAAGGASGR